MINDDYVLSGVFTKIHHVSHWLSASEPLSHPAFEISYVPYNLLISLIKHNIIHSLLVDQEFHNLPIQNTPFQRVSLVYCNQPLVN